MDRTTWIGIFVLGSLSLDVLAVWFAIARYEWDGELAHRPPVPVRRVVIIVLAGLAFAGLTLLAAFQLD